MRRLPDIPPPPTSKHKIQLQHVSLVQFLAGFGAECQLPVGGGVMAGSNAVVRVWVNTSFPEPSDSGHQFEGEVRPFANALQTVPGRRSRRCTSPTCCGCMPALFQHRCVETPLHSQEQVTHRGRATSEKQ